MGAQVRLRLTHENLLPEDLEKDPNTWKGVNNGWPAVLSSLIALRDVADLCHLALDRSLFAMSCEVLLLMPNTKFIGGAGRADFNARLP
jgi:hypothetical protein